MVSLRIVAPTTTTRSEAAQGWLFALEADAKTDATVKDYSEALKRFLAYDAPEEIDQITRSHIRAFLTYLSKERHNSPNTVAYRLRVLRQWWKWMLAEGLASEDPTEGVEGPKLTQRRRDTLTVAQMEKLLKTAAKEPKPLRNTALLLILYDCGLRRAEVAALSVADVNLEASQLRVQGKGRKERAVGMGKTTRQAVWKYLNRERGRDPGPLFPGKYGSWMPPLSVTQIVEQLGLRAGVSPCHPHMFRRAFGVEFIRGGGDPFNLQRLMGHSTIDMTAQYVKALNDQDAINAHRQYGPGDRLGRGR